MAENAHYQQLGKFVVLFQGLENSLVEINSVIADQDYAVEILPAKIEYRRLVESTGVVFSHFVDRLRQPDLEAKARFQDLMKRCLGIGVLRNRLIHSKYALLKSAGYVAAPVQEKAARKFKGAWRRRVIREDLPVESFEPYFRQIAGVVAELASFRLQVIGWK